MLTLATWAGNAELSSVGYVSPCEQIVQMLREAGGPARICAACHVFVPEKMVDRRL